MGAGLIMQTLKRAVRKLIPRPIETPPPPVPAEKSAYSALFSLFEEPGRPTQRLIELGIEAAERTVGIDLPESRPGDELRLLAGLMQALAPKNVLIVGDDSSPARRIIERFLPQGSRVATTAGPIDVSAAADFILLQGPADGEFEARVFAELSKLRFASPPIVMLNDTRLWPMLRFCRQIKHPKLDLTSFGRWSGTLLVELS
jgi:hypothetical protein